MIIALLLVIVGIVLIASIPILGWILGLVFILLGIAVAVLAMVGRGVGALAGFGTSKTCPQCRSRIPAGADVCRYCGYRYD
jgi:hypothetical protein